MDPFGGGAISSLTVEIIASRMAIIFMIVFVLAFVVEGALDGLFNYRHLKKFFDGRGLKYPVSVVVSYGVCVMTGVSIVELMTSGNFLTPFASGFDFGLLVTALFVSRGSKYVAERFGTLKKSLAEFK